MISRSSPSGVVISWPTCQAGGVRHRVTRTVDLEAAPVEWGTDREEVDPLLADLDGVAPGWQVERAGAGCRSRCRSGTLRRHRVDEGVDSPAAWVGTTAYVVPPLLTVIPEPTLGATSGVSSIAYPDPGVVVGARGPAAVDEEVDGVGSARRRPEDADVVADALLVDRVLARASSARGLGAEDQLGARGRVDDRPELRVVALLE